MSTSPRRSARLPPIRLTPAELQAYREAAQAEGLSLSAWVRKSLGLAAAEDLLSACHTARNGV